MAAVRNATELSPRRNLLLPLPCQELLDIVELSLMYVIANTFQHVLGRSLSKFPVEECNPIAEIWINIILRNEPPLNGPIKLLKVDEKNGQGYRGCAIAPESILSW